MYDCNCDDCKTKPQTALNLAVGNNFKSILKRVETAFKQLHKKGTYNPEDIGKVKAYQDLITETSKLLNGAITDNDMPPAMRKSLQEDVFIFSGLKTNAQLLDASRQLLNDKGEVKGFNQFANDVNKIKAYYNQNYLEAEYEFAVSSAQMAGKWADISNDYDLQYRTAKDDKVRASHQALDETTLPADNVFWKNYYPPNGWRCRCNTVEVRKGKYEVSDQEAAIKAGEKATTQLDKNGKNKLELFRFNPGMEKKVFPPKHPYNKVKGAKQVKEIVTKASLDNEVFTFFRTDKETVEKQSYFERAKSINKRIKASEALSVRKYTGSFYDKLNKYLRTSKKPPSEEYNSIVKSTNAGLRKLESFKGVAFRGSQLDRKAFKKYTDALEAGKPHKELAYFSTTESIGKKFNGNTIYKINSKNGKRVKAISQFPNEEEVLFKAGTKFKVNKAIKTKGGYEIEMDEI